MMYFDIKKDGCEIDDSVCVEIRPSIRYTLQCKDDSIWRAECVSVSVFALLFDL